MPAKKRARRAESVEVPIPPAVRGNSHRGAWRKGYLAGQKGRTARANPYALDKSPVVRGLHYTWAKGRNAALIDTPPARS